MNKIILKKISLCLLTIFIVGLSLNTYRGVVNTPAEKLHNYTLAALSLDNIISTDSNNKIESNNKLKLIFVETIYTILVVQDFKTKEPMINILSKPFNKLWIVMKFLFVFAKKFVALIFENLKLNFLKIKFFVFNLTFYLALLTILTRIRTKSTAPLVLRC